MGQRAQPEIYRYASDRFAVYCESAADEHAKKRLQVLGAARRTGNSGAYLPALVDFEAERVRETILAYAKGLVEAFDVYGIACDMRAEKDLETAALRIAGGAIGKTREELRLRSRRLRIPEEGLGIPWNLKIERVKSTALKEGNLLLRQQRAKFEQEQKPTVVAATPQARGGETIKTTLAADAGLEPLFRNSWPPVGEVPADETAFTWVTGSREWLRQDLVDALECPRALRPVKAERLDAIATLRKDAALAVQNTLPQTKQALEVCLWPLLSKYAETLFDRVADARRKAKPNGRVRPYIGWLRTKVSPAVIDDVCRSIHGQFLITVRHVTDTIGERQSPEIDATRRALWGMYTEVMGGGPFTQNLENCLVAHLEGRIPFWEASATQPRPVRASSKKDDPATQRPPRGSVQDSSSKANGSSAAVAKKTPPRRVPDLESSHARVDLTNTLAVQLATIKADLVRYCTPDHLRNKYPGFILWKHLTAGELKELTDGIAFTPKAYAETLTLRAFGITSRETLKKDRQKIRRAAKSKWRKA